MKLSFGLKYHINLSVILSKVLLLTDCSILHYMETCLETCLQLSLKVEYRSTYFLINQSHYRPGQAQRVLRKLRFPDFVTTAQDGGKVVSLMHRPPLPPGNNPGTHFC